MPWIGEARSCSGRVPGMWLAISARGSALGWGSGCCAGAAFQAAAPNSASQTTDFLTTMGNFRRFAAVLEFDLRARRRFARRPCRGESSTVACAHAASAARVVLRVQLLQALARDVRVDLRGRQVA